MNDIITRHDQIEDVLKKPAVDQLDQEVQLLLIWCLKIYDRALAGHAEYRQELYRAVRKLMSSKEYTNLLMNKYPSASSILLKFAQDEESIKGAHG